MENQDQEKITSDTFYSLYQKTSNDEDVVRIEGVPGITIIRKYREDTKYFKDGKRIFIKFHLNDEHIMGSIDLVSKNKDGTFTSFDSTNPYKNPFTNFIFGKEENIIFDNIKQKILIKKKRKTYEFNVNDFVEILVKNHLADRLFWKRKINRLKVFFLSFIFWIIDKKYDWITYYYKIHNSKKISANSIDELDKSINLPAELPIDPFFKYFLIYRKILFVFIIITTVILYYFFNKINQNFYEGSNILFKENNFTISNPIFLFMFFIFLFTLHYLSVFLKEKIYNKEGFIYKLHESSLDNSFSLKIYGTT